MTTDETTTKTDTSLTVHLTLTSEPTSPRIPLTISKTVTTKQLRVQVSETTKIPLSSLKVIVRGRLVGDDDSNVVQSFKLEDGCVLHCMGKPLKDDDMGSAPPLVASTASTVSVVNQPGVASLPAAATAAVAASPSSENVLQAALATMRNLNTPENFLTGVTTLDKVLSNIASHPMEDKYRRVKVQNAAFQKRLGGLAGGDAVMKAIGFVVEPDAKDGEESYVLHASADAWLKLMSCKTEVDQAVVAAKSAATAAALAATPTTASAPPSNPSFPNWPSAPAGGLGNFPGMSDPAMQQTVSQIMSDPQQLQAMLQNPMIQNAMRRDPRIANDPMMLQGLESLASNPAMLSQLGTMMQNPAMQRQMQAFMAGANNAGGLGGGWNNQGSATNATTGGTTPNSSSNFLPQPNATTAAATAAVSDEEMTEEEMIAEAIRRSLQDGS